jgi:biotin--[acetyl-coA-carboxylase] ligase
MIDLNEKQILAYFKEKLISSPHQEKLRIPSVKIFPETGSTNTDMKESLKKEGEASEGAEKSSATLAEGTVYLTDCQSGGRGRQGHSFYSPKGMGIYFSILTRPKESSGNALTITTHAAVAVVRAVKELYNISLSIKWVNDLFLNGKKVCGILAEGKFCPALEYCIMGIGINLFTPEGGYPAEISEIAGSLFGEYQEERFFDFDRNRLMATILYHYFCICDEKEVLPEYRENNLVLGRRVLFSENGIEKEGVVTAITKHGELFLSLDSGASQILLSGEVKFVS